MMRTAILAAFCAVLMAAPATAEQICIASHYGVGDGYGGRRTASGERMNPHAMTAAMRAPVPFSSLKRVRNLATGKTVTVRINDRGPFIAGRCIDLSYGAARAVGMGGLARVSITPIDR